MSKTIARLVLAVLAAGWSVFAAQPALAEGAVTPDRHEFVLQPTEAATADFNVVLQPQGPSFQPLDVAFVFDATNSMTGLIEDFKRNTDKIMDDIAKRSTDVRVAVAIFGDHADLRPCSGRGANAPVPVWQLLTDFAGDRNRARAAVNRARVSYHGCDAQEAYLEALEEARRLSWRQNAVRFVVIVGDAPARSPERGFDDIAGTSDDLDFASINRAYRADGIGVIGIYAVPRNESARQLVASSFSRMADSAEGGMAIPLDQGRSVSDAIAQAIVIEPPPPPPPALRGVTPDLLTWMGGPERHPVDDKGLQYRFTVPVIVPENTESGIYRIDVAAYAGADGSGPAIGAGQIIVKVGWRFIPLQEKLRWLIAAIALLAMAAIILRRWLKRTSQLEYGGVAFWDAARTFGALAAIALMACVAWYFAPADYDSFATSMLELGQYPDR